MSNDICGSGPSGAAGVSCPRCRRPGLPVKQVTVAALVKDEYLPLTTGDGFHLCITPQCPVAYFNGDIVFNEKDLKVPVWFKEHTGPVPVCYCAGVTDWEIMNHIQQGCCSSLIDIQKHTGANTGKQCLTKNPTGR
ncbi:(2Fe-2S)-binding protein [Desulfofundulus thermobenzoicus]|uniref:(2Fe-2S)-binding protein n=1 Tax=Desulfofundulus thermobenzoicus TaxID=29376 RepID=A0A6N7IUE8_9FIRM|nr:(2Fe-2S)-binding protein [Desulfofundulus thermobenzoicus]